METDSIIQIANWFQFNFETVGTWLVGSILLLAFIGFLSPQIDKLFIMLKKHFCVSCIVIATIAGLSLYVSRGSDYVWANSFAILMGAIAFAVIFCTMILRR